VLSLEVKKSVYDTSPNVGDALAFTSKVANNGTDTETNFPIIDIGKLGLTKWLDQ